MLERNHRALREKHPDRPPGRRCVLTAPKLKKFLDTLRSGCYVETALKYANIVERSFYRWLERGEAEDRRMGEIEAKGEEAQPIESEEPYRLLWQAVGEALSYSEVMCVTKIRMSKDPRVLLEFLRLRYRDRYHTKHKEEIAGDPENPIQHAVRIYVPDNGRGPKPTKGAKPDETES